MKRPIEDYDDCNTAAQYAVAVALESGDGVLLRSIKTLMDAADETERLAAYPKAVDEIKSRYPTDVFPDGKGSAAKFARSLCDRIHETAAEIAAAATAARGR